MDNIVSCDKSGISIVNIIRKLTKKILFGKIKFSATFPYL